MKRIALVLLLLASCAVGPSASASREEAVLAAEEAKDVAALNALRAGTKEPALLARIARAYGRVLTPDGVDALINLLAVSDRHVRRETLFAIGQFALKAEFSRGRELELRKTIEPLLSDPDEAVRVAAVEAAGKLSLGDAPTVLLAALKDPSPEVRAEAVIGLYRARLVLRLRGAKPADVADLPKQTLDALVALAGDSDVLVRRNVAYFFFRVKEPRGLEAAKLLSADKQLWTRVYAVGALGRNGDAKVVPLLVMATGDEEYLVRLTAVQALAMLKAGDQIPAKLADDPSYHVRAAMAESCDDDKVLEKLWGDKSSAVRSSALGAIAKKRGVKAAELVAKALKDEDWLIREAAVGAAPSVGKEAESLVLPMLRDADERVAAKAVEVIGEMETKAAFEAVKQALASELLYVRATAVEALAKRKEQEVLEVAWNCYEACSDRKWVEVRESIVDLFTGRVGDESSRRLRMLAVDSSTSVASKARRALVDRGAKDLPPERPEVRAANPHRGLRFTKPPVVVMETTRGTMEIECFAKDAPIHVANFIGLVKAGTYDGLPWHRVVPAFVIQGGDPGGTGMGDAGWPLRAEINPIRYERGTLGMPRSDGFDTGGCQLFFTHLPTPHLDGQYTVFGRIVKGLDVMDAIERGDKIIKATVRVP